MACKTETKVIGEREYSVTQWPIDKSMLMKFRLGKVFSSSLSSIASVIASDKPSEKDEVSALSEGLSSLFQNTSPEELVRIIKDTVIGSACDGERITESSFTELFSGDDMIETYKVFIFVLKVNYSNLFKGQLASRFLAKMPGAQ